MSKDVQLSFEAAIKHLQTTAGYSSEQFETLRRAILAMADNERDTHFAGAARAAVRELLGLRYQTVYYRDPQMLEHYERVIAQFTYDVALHTVTECHKWDMSYMEVPELMAEIPDLTSWPTDPDIS